jgi:DNA (cytosine-5)-methyltransferase 1
MSAGPTAIDLFCGIGGMTLGLKRAGFDIVGALDVSELAVLGFETNHPDVDVWRRDLRGVKPENLMEEFGIEGRGELDLLAGCPPCQGFSRVRTKSAVAVEDPRNGLVAQFARLAIGLLPKALLMENVPALAQDSRRFNRFVGRLERAGYRISFDVLNAVHHGIPQRRRRLVLIACLEADPPAFADRTHQELTVRETIADLPMPGESNDPVHNHGEKRSLTVKRRIKNVPHDGGSFRSSRRRQLKCHRNFDGFNDIYGRMAWDRAAPTITGGCINPSKGRFLHPEQDRAITLREAALLQGFPSEYHIPLDRGKYQAAALIGNALPPDFVADHARTICSDLMRAAG